jgi:hypothetical protein
MAYWSIIGTGNEGNGRNKSFGVTLDTDTGEWSAQGPHVSLFFATRKGDYKFVRIPENGTQLVKAGPKEVAFFTGLNGTSPVGATGSGRASEEGTEKLSFTWKLDSK